MNNQFASCKCGGLFNKYYHGMLGYESMLCNKCGLDYNDQPEEKPETFKQGQLGGAGFGELQKGQTEMNL